MEVSTSFPMPIAQIVSLYMQSIVYGMGVITVAYGLRVLLWTRGGRLKSRRDVNGILVIVTLAMFVIATMEVGFGMQGNLNAFIYYNGPGGANAVFSDISNWVNVMRTVDYVLQTSIGDSILVYRCYVVYGRSWKFALIPGILWLAEIVCGAAVIYTEATLHTTTSLENSHLKPFITGVLAITLTMTTITTGMIVFNIIRVNNLIASQDITRLRGGNRRLTRIVRILVESGLIYTVSVAVFFITYLAKHNSQYGVSDCVVQLIPISFTLIIIRVDRGVAVQNTTMYGLSTIPTSITLEPLPKPSPGASFAPSQGTAVRVSHFAASHTGGDNVDETGNGWKGGEPLV